MNPVVSKQWFRNKNHGLYINVHGLQQDLAYLNYIIDTYIANQCPEPETKTRKMRENRKINKVLFITMTTRIMRLTGIACYSLNAGKPATSSYLKGQ